MFQLKAQHAAISGNELSSSLVVLRALNFLVVLVLVVILVLPVWLGTV